MKNANPCTRATESSKIDTPIIRKDLNNRTKLRFADILLAAAMCSLPCAAAVTVRIGRAETDEWVEAKSGFVLN